MSALWLTFLLLMLAAIALFLIAGGRGRAAADYDRDRLNAEFYQRRLHELEEDEAQGVIADRAIMVNELQQTLLEDIPEQNSHVTRRGRFWLLLPGVVLLVLVTFGCYLYSGGLGQYASWLQIQQDYPALRARMLDPQAQPLSLAELTRFQAGLRTALQQDPDNLADWKMLGRLGMVLNNTAGAEQAFRRALQLSADDLALQQDYAEVLTRSADPQDNRQAALMLSDMRSRQGDNLRTLDLLAWNAFQQQQYAQAIGAWQRMLTILPAGDRHRPAIERSIAQAKTAAGQQNTQLALTVTITPQAEKMLPPDGVMYISVTDGVSLVPVAVKRLPISHFPSALTLDDSDAMTPERLLSALHQVQVRVRISRNGSATPQSGDWLALSAITSWDHHQPMAVEINQQQP